MTLAVHCSQWDKAKCNPSQNRDPWTDCQNICHKKGDIIQQHIDSLGNVMVGNATFLWFLLF